MPTYRVLFSDLLTKTVHGELPVESFRFSETLNAPGSFSGTLALDPDDGPVPIVTDQTLSPWRTAVWVERDGSLVWGGPVITLDADVESNALTVGAEGFHAYFRRRAVKAKLVYGEKYGATIQDQTLIAKDLLRYAQSVPGGNVGVLTTGATATGQKRDLLIQPWERKNIGETIDGIAGRENGFHFRYAVDWDPAASVQTPRVTFRTYFPVGGRKTDYTFQLGTNVELLGMGVDGDRMATVVDALGVGEGSKKLIRSKEDPTLRGVVPVLDHVLSLTDVRETSTLDAHAARRLRLGKAPIRLPELAVHGGSIPTFGSYLPGEQVRVVGSYGYLAVDGFFRLVAFDVTVDQNGGEEVKITLAPTEVFDE